MNARLLIATLLSGLSSTLLSANAQDARFFRVVGPVPTTISEVTPDGWVTWTNIPTNATFTVQTTTALPDETNWVDWVQVPVSNAVTVHRVFDPDPPAGMAFIPAGVFLMGATTNMGHEANPDEIPQHRVYVSSIYMDRTEVTNDKMVEVMQWAYQQGKISVTSATVRNLEGNQQELLDLDFSSCRITWNGSQFQMKAAKGSGYPCVEVSWYGATAFSNYRSQMEGLTPCYNLNDWSCDWNADGYRLPTEAEWEKAARGGLSGKRFPWADTITHSQANYFSAAVYAYDISPTRGNHPDYDDGGYPYTNPVWDFAPNAYGLHDMAGNNWELCWDWYLSNYYISSPSSDPRGPASGSERVARGGTWGYIAPACRTAARNYGDPSGSAYRLGFRCGRAAGQ